MSLAAPTSPHTTSPRTTAPTIAWESTGLPRLAAIALIALGLLRMLPAFSFTSFHNDFSHYYLGGSMFANGLNPYTEHLQPHCEAMGVPFDPKIPYAAHPPLILFLFSGLAQLPPAIAYGAWLVIQVGCFILSLELTRRIVKARWQDAGWLLCIGIFANAVSLQALFYYSQVQLMVACLIYGALWARLQGRSATACGLITLAAAFKLYPAVLVPWFFFQPVQDRRDYLRRGLVMVGVGLVCLLLPGVQTWLDFVTLGLPALSDNALRWTNYSVQNLVMLASGTPTLHAWIGHPKLTAMTLSMLVLAGAYATVLFKRRDAIVACSILLAAATFGGIITWSHYLTILFLPVAWMWITAARQACPGWMKVAVFVAGAVLLTPQVDLIYLDAHQNVGQVLLHFYPLATAGFACWLMLRLQAEHHEGESVPV